MSVEEILQSIQTIPALAETIGKLEIEIHSLRDDLKQSRHDVKPPQVYPNRKFLSLKQAAEELNVSASTIRRLLERGLLKTSRGLRVIRIPVDEIETYKRRTILP